MILIPSILLVLIFTFISALHFYWAFGGRWGIHNSVPTNEEGKRMLHPGIVASFVVACGLLAFAFYYLLLSGVIDFVLPAFVLPTVGWIIPAIFFLRAIGDFKYVGFTKKIKGTTFAKLDSRYFAPLCLLMALLGFLTQLLK
jgi:Protein of unknown function (DUF3995)